MEKRGSEQPARLISEEQHFFVLLCVFGIDFLLVEDYDVNVYETLDEGEQTASLSATGLFG